MADTKRQASSGEVDDLRRENGQLKLDVAELLLQNRVLKKCGWLGDRVGRLVRYTQAAKMGTIRLVEVSDWLAT